MNNAVILHGKPPRERYEDPAEPEPHEGNWLPWLGEQLSAKGIDVAIPALPKPYFPVYEDWREVFERQTVDNDSALIGHSAGAEFILRWLSETKASVERIALVAPYSDFDRKYGEFSEYELDRDLIKRIGRMSILNSRDDDQPIQRNIQRLLTAFPDANLLPFENHGHFRIGHNMTSEEFPELLDELSQ